MYLKTVKTVSSDIFLFFLNAESKRKCKLNNFCTFENPCGSSQIAENWAKSFLSRVSSQDDLSYEAIHDPDLHHYLGSSSSVRKHTHTSSGYVSGNGSESNLCHWLLC